ncbi:MerR family transcriptional regulator [Nocardioides sp. BGMRC 2183]|nr:MerR family transcriptional regulator [Nocardioides sp. BGMRC 2183]
MWMAELAARAQTPVPTVKYYLREQLLPAGERIGATRSSYSEEHVRRLRLIRALVDVAGMGLDAVRDVLAAVDAEAEHGNRVEALGTAHGALSPRHPTTPSATSRQRVADLVSERGWHVDPDGPHGRALSAALDAMDAAEHPLEEAALAVYADAMTEVAAAEVDATLQRAGADAVTYAVTGTVLAEPVLLALRRMAQQDEALRRG